MDKAVDKLFNAKPKKNNPDCTLCDISKTSGTVCCPSTGPKKSPIMLVGESLGPQEEELGENFVGDAGKKLNYCLEKAGMPRSKLRLTNACRCRTGNRVPKKAELVNCWSYLLHDILTGKPKVIVALGIVATDILLPDKKYAVDKWRGFPVDKMYTWQSPKGKLFMHSVKIIPTYHPSACLKDWAKDDLLISDLKTAYQYAKQDGVLKHPITEVEVVKGHIEFDAMIRKLTRAGKFVVDLETTGFNCHSDKVLCIGFCYKPDKAYVLPLIASGKPIWGPTELKMIKTRLADCLESSKLIGQNLKFDLKFLRKLLGIKDVNVYFDTMLAHHCLDENRKHNLTYLCQKYLKWDKYDSVMDKYKANYGEAPDQLLWNYCGYDVDGTYQLYQKLKPLLIKDKSVKPFKTELALTNPLADTEYRGVKINTPLIHELSKKYREEQTNCREKLNKIAAKLVPDNKEFNPNSQKQLAALLQAAKANLRKKTGAGNISVDRIVLNALALKKNKAGTIAKLVLELRKYTKWVSTYLDGKDGDGGFLKYVSEKNTIHASYNLHIARTARLSADDPAIQTLPKVGGLRGMFIPDRPDHVFLSVDYNKIELCVMAYLASDKVMIKELRRGDDLHTRMALTVKLNRNPTDKEFKERAGEISKLERSVAKSVIFGVSYGRTAPAIVEANPEAFPSKMSKRERIRKVDGIIDAYFRKYKAIKEYMDYQVEKSIDDRGVRSPLTGRKRRLTGYDWFESHWSEGTASRDKELGHLGNEAKNFDIQNTASTILNQVTAKCYWNIQEAGIPGFRIVMTLHDQLIFNCPKSHVEKASKLIRDWMEIKLPKTKKFKYSIKLEVDVDVQRFWGDNEY